MAIVEGRSGLPGERENVNMCAVTHQGQLFVSSHTVVSRETWNWAALVSLFAQSSNETDKL